MFLGIIISILFITNCTKDQAGPNACFQEDVLPIFISKCSMDGCHNSKDRMAGYDLSNYEGIRKGVVPKQPFRSEIYNTIKGNNPSMPESPYPKLSVKDVNTIKLWINKGALNTTNCKGCDTAIVTYNKNINDIMQRWCVGCHNSTNKGGGFDLSNYQELIKAIPDSKLLGSIKQLNGYSAMPKNSNRISDCEIGAIQKWINGGFPNN